MADTILLVDDDAMLRETLALNLRNAGYEVRTAADGMSALQEAQARIPDLVILDLMLQNWMVLPSAALCGSRPTSRS